MKGVLEFIAGVAIIAVFYAVMAQAVYIAYPM